MEGQFEDGFEANDPAVEVVETSLLLLHQRRHLFHLVVHPDWALRLA
jgi:hypothetical protein